MQQLPRLDGVINNACQTIRRPARFYQHLIDAEMTLQPARIEGLLRHASEATPPLLEGGGGNGAGGEGGAEHVAGCLTQAGALASSQPAARAGLPSALWSQLAVVRLLS